MNIDERLLRSLNDQLIIKNKEMEQLVAHVAHELLTPTTSLMMTTDNLLDHFEDLRDGGKGFYSNAEILDFMERIARNSNDLKDQTMHILNYFSSRKLEAKTTLVSVGQLAGQAIDDIAEKCEKNQIKLEINSLGPTEILASPQSIRTILRNIIGNAMKFTIANKNNENKIIEVIVDGTGPTVDLSIQDSGIGMPEIFHTSQHIYDFGTRADNAVSREVRGYGLGLRAVKQLLDSLGGTISFASAENKGTTAFISLPKDEEEEIII